MTDPDLPTPDAHTRVYTLADLIILIAGFGVGIAWVRALAEAQGGYLLRFPLPHWRTIWWAWIVIPTPLFVSLGVATFICRLQAPCPPFRRLARQPGTTALAVLTLLVLWEAGIVVLGAGLEPLLDWLTPRPSGVEKYYAARLGTFTSEVLHAGALIAITWTIQVAAGRWRPERSWFDRTGRFIGIGLIALDLLRSLGLAARV